jgi:hypothetical protein
VVVTRPRPAACFEESFDSCWPPPAGGQRRRPRPAAHSAAAGRGGMPVFDRRTGQVGATTCSSPATSARTGRCCTRRPTTAASPATTPAASPTCACTRAARRWRWCSATRRSMLAGAQHAELKAAGTAVRDRRGVLRRPGPQPRHARNRGALHVYGERARTGASWAPRCWARRPSTSATCWPGGAARRHRAADARQPLLPPGDRGRPAQRAARAAARAAHGPGAGGALPGLRARRLTVAEQGWPWVRRWVNWVCSCM